MSLEQMPRARTEGQADHLRSEQAKQTPVVSVYEDDPEWLQSPTARLPKIKAADKEQGSEQVHASQQQGANATAFTSSPQQAPSSQSPKPQSVEGGSPANGTPTLFQRLRRTIFRKRVPELRQVSATECAAACLAMMLSYYGRPSRVSEVRERIGIGRDGLSALALVKAARQYGLRVRAVSLQQSDLRAVSLPAIIYWEFNHYMIVERWSAKQVHVVDPALGRRVLTRKEFDEGFTGALFLMEPGVQFDRTAIAPKLSLMSYLRSLIQAPGLVMQILSASVILQLFGLISPLLTQLIIDQVLPSRSMSLLQILIIGMLLLMLAQAFTSLLRSSLLNALQTRLDTQMRLNFFEHLLSLPYRFFQLRSNGDLLARISSQNAIRDLLTNQIISTVLDVSTVLIYLVILFVRAPVTAGVTLGIGAVQVVSLLATGPLVHRLTRQMLIAQGRTQGYLNEALAGVATLKAAGAEPRALEKWSNLFFEEQHLAVRNASISAVMGTVLGLIRGGAPLILLSVGATQVIQGNLSLGSMLSINALASAFLVPLNSLAATGQQVQQVQAHFERIADILEADAEQNVELVKNPPRLSGDIEVEDVSFQYDAQAPLVLRDVSVSIKAGQKVALVGKTGSGKSTLGKLLIGLITPTHGIIRYNGLPLHTLNYQEVRRQFGVVLQEASIFSGSVRENISFNAPGIPMDRVKASAQMAALDQDIDKMPMGYDTLVSEAGSALSGGQRQRLALARALAAQPAILLLDEATSSLDVVTEQQVDYSLNMLSCTRVVIAHRLSTIKNADVILVVDQGRIVERGTHEELLQKQGVYAKLIHTQMSQDKVVR